MYQDGFDVLIGIISDARESSKVKHSGIWAKRLLMDSTAGFLVGYSRMTRCRFNREETGLITRAVRAEISILSNSVSSNQVIQVFWKY